MQSAELYKYFYNSTNLILAFFQIVKWIPEDMIEEDMGYMDLVIMEYWMIGRNTIVHVVYFWLFTCSLN